MKTIRKQLFFQLNYEYHFIFLQWRNRIKRIICAIKLFKFIPI